MLFFRSIPGSGWGLGGEHTALFVVSASCPAGREATLYNPCPGVGVVAQPSAAESDALLVHVYRMTMRYSRLCPAAMGVFAPARVNGPAPDIVVYSVASGAMTFASTTRASAGKAGVPVNGPNVPAF